VAVARKLTVGSDIRLLMVRAVADVTVECAPLELAKRYRESTVADGNVIELALD